MLPYIEEEGEDDDYRRRRWRRLRLRLFDGSCWL